MNHINKLQKLLQQHFEYEKRRLRFITLFVVSLIRVQTISLNQLALVFNSNTKTESNYRRIQRFFKDFEIDYMQVARFIISSLSQEKFILTLDRTNWQFGKRDINILMLAVVYKDTSIPLCWDLLNKRGNSSYQERIEIISKALTIIGSSRIRCLVADREFGSGRFLDI